jgi:hypothetical protein
LPTRPGHMALCSFGKLFLPIVHPIDSGVARLSYFREDKTDSRGMSRTDILVFQR